MSKQTTSLSNFELLKTLVEANQPVMLLGEAGTGKTTLFMDVASDLNLDFFALSMTRQTTLSHILGFNNINGVYVRSQLRDAIEFGGLFLLDEIDAADPNVILSLNTIQNGYVSFPDGLVEVHKDFRLGATANTQNDQSRYTGRAMLDAATLDRFDKITIEIDPKVESSLLDKDVQEIVEALRKTVIAHHLSSVVTMRDALRIQKRKDLNLLKGYPEALLKNEEVDVNYYETTLADLRKVEEESNLPSDCKTLDELYKLLTN